VPYGFCGGSVHPTCLKKLKAICFNVMSGTARHTRIRKPEENYSGMCSGIADQELFFVIMQISH
jgi:hypothetical protein